MMLEEQKAAARKAAFERRRVAHAGAYAASGYLSEVLAGYRGVPLAGYMPMRTEINPLPAMAEAAAHGPVGVPVIMGAGQALRFSLWEPEGEMKDGPFGAQIPVVEAWMEPEILIVPLVAFDRQGGRLGYGGGFYDRTLEALRRGRRPTIVGIAYDAQLGDRLAREPHDAVMDFVVTERRVIRTR